MDKSKLKLIYVLILLQPFIDLITALTTRFDLVTISLGIVFRGILVLLMLVYLFFFNRSKYRRKSILYLLLLGIFYLFYLLTKTELWTNFSLLYNELVYIFRYSYLIVMVITVVNFFDQYQIKRREIVRLLIIDLMIYVALLIIPFLTKTAFHSYNNNEGFGYCGWFYSANEISCILALLYPLLFMAFDKKCSIKNCLMIIITIISIIIIGTKAPFYSMILFSLVMTGYYLFNIKKKKGQFIFILLILLAVFIGKSYTPVNVNLEQRKECLDEYQEGNIDNSDNTFDLKCEVAEGQQIVILSGREALLTHVFKVYKQSPLVDKFLGIGFSNRQVLNDERWSVKLIEMDLFDILFRFGIIGFIIYMSVIILIIIQIARNVFKRKFNLSLEQLIYSYITAIGIGLSLFIGHIFGSPSVSFYLAIIISLALQSFGENKIMLNRQKITFLSLHLGTGGIEKATINTVNSLCKSKDVEIICFYHLQKDPAYKVDKRVKIKYLCEDKPNREEIFSSLKNHQWLSLLKNLMIAFKILWKRRYLMIKEIKKIKEGIIVSTRVEFSTILSEYGNDSVVKIAQEHNHHRNNRKYINKMKYYYGGIDYVMALTNSLKNDYEKIFKGSLVKVIVMPNMLDNIPLKKASLKKKNVIFVGRLDPIKRINEIIDLAYLVEDKSWHFNIIGSGPYEAQLKKQIKELNLEDNVHLLGNYDHDQVMNALYNSSIFIMTSISEGLPMVLLEAMSVGVPCIAYETLSGVNDIITNNKDGYVIKNRNQKEMLNKLLLLMNNVNKRCELGNNAYVKAQSFSEENITNKWLTFIDDVNI